MSKKIEILTEEEGRKRAYFHCEGCGSPHAVYIDGKGKPTWSFNGSVEKPTFKPSVLCRWTEGENHTPKICHSFVTDGKIQYLNDCTHHLAGKTIELIDFEL